MANNLSADELLSSLGLSPTTAQVKKEAKDKPKTKFLTNQYVLFSTPILIIYLQGVLPLVASANDAKLVRVAFQEAKKRKLTTGRTLEQLQAADAIIDGDYTVLYANPDLHKKLLAKLMELGLTLQTDKVASRTNVLQTINKYLDDLATFLATEGYSSPEDYLIKTAKETNELSSTEMLAALDDL